MVAAGEPEQDGFLGDYLPYLLRRADQTLSAPFYAVLTKHEIARSDWRVLAVLEEFASLSVLDLAAAALSPQPTVTHALRRLEKRGFVSHTPGTDDKRQRFISITPAGSRLTRSLMAEAKRLEADALAGADDVRRLIVGLKALMSQVEAKALTQTETQSQTQTETQSQTQVAAQAERDDTRRAG